MASNSNGEAPPAPAGAPSLAQWRSGAAKMTTAEAGKQVAQTAPPKPRPKAPSSSKPVLSTRPWHEQSVEERYGNRAPKVPVNINKQIRDTLRYLEAFQDRECSWEEIATNGIPSWYDTEEGGELFNALSSNERVQATSTGFKYLSKFGIKDKQSLLKHIRDCPTGLRSIDFKDSYTNALEDADKLHAEGLLYKLWNAEFKYDVFFPAAQALVEDSAELADLVDTYLKTELPEDPQVLIQDVKASGKRSALACARTDRKPLGMLKQEKTKKKRKLNLKHVTNTHLAQMFVGDQYTSID